MPTVGFPDVPDSQDVSVLRDYLIKHMRDMSWNLNNLDSLNIREIDAKIVNVENVNAESINTGTLDATLVTIRSALSLGYINIDGNGMVVNNGTFNTFEVDMNGEVTMTQALIRSNTAYPYVEIDPTGNFFRAAANNITDIQIRANPDLLDSPQIFFNFDNYSSRLGMIGSILDIRTLNNDGRILMTAPRIDLAANDGVTTGNIYLLGNVILPKGSSIPLGGLPSVSSSATTVEDLRADFNTAMAYLEAMGIFD